jgi:predicted RNase H-like HicB family nuclease
MRYLVVIERTPNNYGAYVPDLPGCISVGDSLEEVTANIREALELHLEGMLEDGDPIPPPTSTAIEVEVAVEAKAAGSAT